jgi:outer membrane protein TolC
MNNQTRTSRHRVVPVAVALAGLTLGACANVAGGQSVQIAQAGGTPAAARTAAETRRDAPELRAEIERRLGAPLSTDDAVLIALLNNRSLRATYFSVGLLDGDLAQALSAIETGSGDIERRFVLASIGTRSRAMASEVDRRKGNELKLEVAAEMLRLAAEVRSAYGSAVAAEQSARYMGQARSATEATLDLTRRGSRVGNWPKVNELREQVFHGEMTAQLARARQAAMSQRERLTRLLGLWGQDIAYKLPERLPDLPSQPLDGSDLESIALTHRLDLQAAQIDIIADAREMELEHYGNGELLTGRTRFTTLDEVDYFRDNTIRTEGVVRTTQVPVFDREQGRVDRRMLPFIQALDRYAELGVMVRSEVRDAYNAYRTAYDVAKHYRDEIIPLRKQIGEEQVYRYNGMLISVFELLADAREQISAVIASIEAQRDFWQAEADLRLAMTTGGAPPRGGARAARMPASGAGGGH